MAENENENEDDALHRSFYVTHFCLRQLMDSSAVPEEELARMMDTKALEEPMQCIELATAILGRREKIRFSRWAIAYLLVDMRGYTPARVERILELSDSARSKFKEYIKDKMSQGKVLSPAQLDSYYQEAALQAFKDLQAKLNAHFKLAV